MNGSDMPADAILLAPDGDGDYRRRGGKGVGIGVEKKTGASDIIRCLPVQSQAIFENAPTPLIGWGREGLDRRWRPRTKNSKVSDIMSLYRGTTISVLVSNDEHYQVPDDGP